MRRRRVLVALAGTAGAGCLRLSNESDDGTATPGFGTTRRATATTAPSTATERPSTEPPTETPTETPTATRTEPPTAEPGPQYPPGMSDAGLTEDLVDAHVEALAASSFTLAFQHRNETVDDLWADRHVRVTAQRAVFQRRDDDVEYFVELDTDRTTWRSTGDGETVYGDLTQCCVGRVRALAMANRGHGAQTLWVAVTAGDWSEPETVQVGDSTFFEVTATGVSDAESFRKVYEADTVNGYSATARVSPAGVVRDLASTIDLTGSDGSFRVTTQYDVSDVGFTVVDRPAWVDTARERAPRISARLLDDRRVLRLDHEGGDAVESGATLGLHRADATDGFATLETAFESGQTLYAEQGPLGEVSAQLGERPGLSDRVTLDDGWVNLEDHTVPANHYKSGYENVETGSAWLAPPPWRP